MSSEIEFEDTVDFESEEESSESEEEEVEVIKLPSTTFKQNGVCVKKDQIKKDVTPGKETNDTFTKDYNSKALLEDPTEEIPSEKVSTKRLTESLASLTDDDEITKILNTKYNGKAGHECNNSNEFKELNGFKKSTDTFNGTEELELCAFNNIDDETNSAITFNKPPKHSSSERISQQDEFNKTLQFAEPSKLPSSSPVDFEKKEGKDSMAGRIEMTRNYLKALTPDESVKNSVEKEVIEESENKKNAFFEIGKRNEELTEIVEKSSKDFMVESNEDLNDALKDVEDILDNDESGSLQRRQSMDDFIKKILAEAREEKQTDSDDGKPPMAPRKTIDNTATTEEVRPNIMKETDLLLERMSSSEDSEKCVDKNLNNNGVKVENRNFSKLKDKCKEINKDVVQNYKEDEIKMPTTRNRHRIGHRERDEAEDEIEQILSSKRYDTSDDGSTMKINKNNRNNVSDDYEKDEQSSYVNGDTNEDFRDFLNKFKKDRNKLFGKEKQTENDSQRSAEVQDFINDRTQNIRAVIDQQANICENVKSVSKQLDDLEKELREVRQATLKRKSKLEALENAVNAERKQYEIEHNSAVERNRNTKPIQKYTQEVKKQITDSILNKKQLKYGKFSDDQDDILSLLSSTKRRGGSVCSVASLMEEQNGFMSANSFKPSNDFQKYRSMSKERDTFGGWNFDRRESSSSREGPNRSSFAEANNFEHLFSGQSDLLSQGRARSRASVATMDSTNSTADDFLSKIRSKYSFLNSKEPPTNDQIENSRGGVLEKMSYSGIKHMNTPSPLSHSNQFSIPTPAAFENYGTGQSRRALSVSDGRSSIHYDKHIGGYTAFPTRNHYATPSMNPVRSTHSRGVDSKQSSTGGGEFKSRFLDKVRERRASAIEHIPGTSKLADRVMAKLNKDSTGNGENEAVLTNGD